jgi:enoyl-CoA hydratase
MKEYQTLLTELSKGVLIVTINREDKLNALNATVFAELNDVLDEIYTNPEISSVIITGKGSKAFVAGADIVEFASMSVEEGRALARRGQAVFLKIEVSPKPIIAAVNGFALGGGCELSMACHIRIASESARFGQPEVNLGLIPGYGGTQRLVQLIGKGKALEMLMTADMIDAACAHKLGLVNDVVQTVELLDHCKAMAIKIGSKAPYAVAQVIQSVYAHYKDGLDGFDTEVNLFGSCFGTADFKEGTTAFIEKRKPTFVGK